MKTMNRRYHDFVNVFMLTVYFRRISASILNEAFVRKSTCLRRRSRRTSASKQSPIGYTATFRDVAKVWAFLNDLMSHKTVVGVDGMQTQISVGDTRTLDYVIWFFCEKYMVCQAPNTTNRSLSVLDFGETRCRSAGHYSAGPCDAHQNLSTSSRNLLRAGGRKRVPHSSQQSGLVGVL